MIFDRLTIFLQSKYHKVWYYVMCTTSTTNTTKCGAVNRAVLIGMERKSKSGERHVFIETTSEQVKLVYLWFHRFFQNATKCGTKKCVPRVLQMSQSVALLTEHD